MSERRKKIQLGPLVWNWWGHKVEHLKPGAFLADPTIPFGLI